MYVPNSEIEKATLSFVLLNEFIFGKNETNEGREELSEKKEREGEKKESRRIANVD